MWKPQLDHILRDNIYCCISDHVDTWLMVLCLGATLTTPPFSALRFSMITLGCDLILSITPLCKLHGMLAFPLLLLLLLVSFVLLQLLLDSLGELSIS
jgi:hypothetical protein